jgi:hypothetical protein
MLLFGAFSIWMGLFILARHQWKRFAFLQFILGMVIFLSFQGQRFYYEEKIPHWKKEESVRRLYSYIFNHSPREDMLAGTPSDRITQELVKMFFLCEKDLVNEASIREFAEHRVRRFNTGDQATHAWYWLFISLRPYLFIMGGFMLLLITNSDLKALRRFIYMSLFCIGVFLALCLFFKITEVILLAVLSAVMMSAICCDPQSLNRRPLVVAVIVLLAGTSWMAKLLVNQDRQHIREINYARAIITELNDHRDILFIDAGTFFDLHLSIWDTPAKYPILNFIYNELFVSNSYESQLNRLGIHDLMNEIPVRNDIYLIGAKASLFVEYYRVIQQKTVQLIKVPGFHYIDAYQLNADSTK